MALLDVIQACLAEIVCNAAEKNLVILTGNNVQAAAPILCKTCASDIIKFRRLE